jgi:hypothetical protein
MNNEKAIEENEIAFSNEQTEEHQALMEEEFAKTRDTTKKTVIVLGEEDGDMMIDVDDI